MKAQNSIPNQHSAFSRAKLGTAVYRMAWFAEIGLFTLAMLVAVFNVTSVWNQGSRMQGILMAGGWIVIAIMQLCVIPMAGALRVCRWKDKPLALIGVVGMTGLSAWTIYEFNEFASYQMTRPARDAVIQVQQKRQQLANVRAELENAARRFEGGTNNLAQLAQDQAVRLAALEREYQQQTETRRREHEQRLKGLESGLPKPAALDQSTQESIRALQEKVRSVEADRDAQIAALSKRAQEDRAKQTEEQAARRTALQSQRRDLQGDVEKIRQAMMTEMESVTGAFKQTKRNLIRDQYNPQIDKLTEQIAMVDEEIRKASQVSPAGTDTEADSVRTRAATEIAGLDRQIERIRAEARASLGDYEKQHEKETGRVRAEMARVEQDYQKAMGQDRTKYEADVENVRRSFAERSQKLAKATMNEADLQQRQATGHAEAERLEAAVATIEAETDRNMEPVLYYRIAKWFHKGPGLPTKDDYLRGQIYLFAPAGILLGLVAIVLAYVGTGLRDDQNRPQVEREEAAAREQRLLNQERERHHKEMQAMEHRLELERGLHRTKLLAVENRVTDLHNKIVGNKLDVAETVVSIPQTIVLQQQPFGSIGVSSAWTSSKPSPPGANGCPAAVNQHVVPSIW